MPKNTEKQYIYIVQAALEKTKCKIGKTNDLARRLKEYNAITGKSKDNVYEYLFACEVKNSARVESDLAVACSHLREEASREIYFFNAKLLKHYINFIKSHEAYVEEVIVKVEPKKDVTKIIQKVTPPLEERGITKKELLQTARKNKNDEFYTRYEDIEKELSMYDPKIWKDKTVFCNCDDAVDDDDRRTSAFPLYFIENFRKLGLKKLICTHYSGPYDIFHQGAKGYIFTKIGYREFYKYPDDYNGSFDHPLSLEILREEADIVCTNPPFSRAIDYWETLIKSGKKFIIISNISNAINTAYIPYFMNNKVWAGYNRVDYFQNPKKQLVDASGHWYTNISIKKRPKWEHLKIVPLKEIPEKYKKYDDSKTLLVDNCYAPSDYKKPFAVSTRPILNGLLEKGYKIVQDTQYIPYVNEEKKFSRVLIQKI